MATATLAALTVEPVCLKIMPPAFTGWPPNTFTPRRFDSESLPFFVEPAPFLCAASITRQLRGAQTGLQLLTDAPVKALARMLVANMMSAAVFSVVVLDSRQSNQEPLQQPIDRWNPKAFARFSGRAGANWQVWCRNTLVTVRAP